MGPLVTVLIPRINWIGFESTVERNQQFSVLPQAKRIPGFQPDLPAGALSREPGAASFHDEILSALRLLPPCASRSPESRPHKRQAACPGATHCALSGCGLNSLASTKRSYLRKVGEGNCNSGNREDSR